MSIYLDSFTLILTVSTVKVYYDSTLLRIMSACFIYCHIPRLTVTALNYPLFLLILAVSAVSRQGVHRLQWSYFYCYACNT